MGELQQYGLLLALLAGVVLAAEGIYLLARRLGPTLREPGKDIPFTGGTLDAKPVWNRYHIGFYGFALLFLAFDMEMAYMYPWAVVYQQIGISALAEMGIFLIILFLGILYGWSEGALERQ